MRVAITGAAGSLAADIIPALLEVGVELVCVDRTNPTTDLGLEWRLCSTTDREELKAAFVGCDAVIHLAGIPLEDEWERILENNIDGTQAVLDTALHAGVDKVVLASSIQATGFVGIPADEAVPADMRVRPNTFYGVSLGVPPAGTSGTGVIFGDKFADTDSAQKFFNAIAKASKDLQGEARYSDENLKMIAEATDQDVDKLKSVPLYTWLPNLTPLPEQLADMESVWVDAGALEYKTAIPQEQYIDGTFAEKVN